MIPCAPSWYCVRTQCKREHIAAHWLRSHLQMEVFLPRIRFQRSQPRGLVWFTEALFPTYLFARFELGALIQQVDWAPGIRGVVRFRHHCPSIPGHVIDALQAGFGPDEVRVLDHSLRLGQTVRLAGGAFHGLDAVVTRVLPARQRVVVLLEFLGRQTMVEVETAGVERVEEDVRRQLSF
jgi:transcriptional antiterminator RfaH